MSHHRSPHFLAVDIVLVESLELGLYISLVDYVKLEKLVVCLDVFFFRISICQSSAVNEDTWSFIQVLDTASRNCSCSC